MPPFCPSLLPQNNFERNMTDIFMVKAKDVGELTRIVVGTGGRGVGIVCKVQVSEGARGS